MLKKDFLLAILVAAIWGANYSVIEMGLASLDPFLLTALRFTLSHKFYETEQGIRKIYFCIQAY